MNEMRNLKTDQEESITKPDEDEPVQGSFFIRLHRDMGRLWIVLTILAFSAGVTFGYRLGLQKEQPAAAQSDSAIVQVTADNQTSKVNLSVKAIMDQVNPPNGYTLPARYGNLGPRLLTKGAIDYQKFMELNEQNGSPLTDEQKAILSLGLDQPIVITPQNSYFLLNFFWAVGLTNQNVILEKGAMMQNAQGQLGNYASTGGWTLGKTSATNLYASVLLIKLTSEQQKRLEDVSGSVYRPCCNNPTNFPDCNHGMALLGLLELLASQDASEDQMFEAAKYVNAFWFPQQYFELATLFKAQQNLDFSQADPRMVVSDRFSSASGFKAAGAWLEKNNLLQQAPGGGSSCGV